MKFYPKLKMFKNSNATNTFDGFEARSYSWYVYAYVIDNKVWICENTYSPTTSKHMGEFRSLVGYETEKTAIYAPRGLNNLGDARKSIASEISRLETELLSKRIRNRQERLDRIESLKIMLTNCDQLEAALANRSESEAA